jgi:uncharacterized membrane protein
MKNESGKKQSQIQRVAGRLHQVVPILDAAGKVIHYAVSPLRVELRRRDVMQIIVGSAILAIPVGFTEETWKLGETLPLINVLILGMITLLFIAAYVYFNFFKDVFYQQLFNYAKRVLAIYLLSLFVVGLLLTIIQRAPWAGDFSLALKRTIIVTFPSAMSAAVSDAVD